MGKSLIPVFILMLACGPRHTAQTESAASEATDTGAQRIPAQVDASSDSSITIDPQDVSGAMGQVTFSQDDKTLFYYDLKAKTGNIFINGVPKTIDQYTADSATGTYTLAGDGFRILAKNARFKENTGEDCFYGTFPEATLTTGSKTLKLDRLQVQDCPNT